MLEQVILDGYDPWSQTTMDPIQMWDDWEKRSKVVAKAPHGTVVDLIKREGDGLLIQWKNIRGWVTFWFVKEFKEGIGPEVSDDD